MGERDAMERAKAVLAAGRRLCRELEPMAFGKPVTHVYNPLIYAAKPHAEYVARYADSRKRVVYLGMNPGPFGMAQTGVPFGEVSLVRDFLAIAGRVDKPEHEHPARLIDGFACKRSEVSGARLWGAVQARHGQAPKFFKHAFVANYCPLVFMEDSGRNRTPDKLLPKERAALYAACDAHLRELVAALEPQYVIGVGKFAEGRALEALHEQVAAGLQVGTIPHPSPANPAANRGWAESVDRALATLGLTL